MPDMIRGAESGNILRCLPKYYDGKERSMDVVFVFRDDECGKYRE